MSETEREPAPANSLPDWSECSLRVENSNYLAKRKEGGGYGPEESTAPQATELHRFIYEYDDADLYRSAWFMYRLELLLNETKADLQRQLAEKTAEAKDLRSHYKWALAEIEAMRPMVEKVMAYRIKLIAYSPAVLGSECVTAQTEMFKALDEYEARKQP